MEGEERDTSAASRQQPTQDREKVIEKKKNTNDLTPIASLTSTGYVSLLPSSGFIRYYLFSRTAVQILGLLPDQIR